MKKYQFAAMATTAIMLGLTDSAHASGSGTGFNTISQNISSSVNDIPRLLSVMSYLVGLGLAIAGVLKLKAHVDNPQTPLKEGVIRLGSGGALLALPAVIDAMVGTVGTGGTAGQDVINTFDAVTF